MIETGENRVSERFRSRLISGGLWAVAGKSASACGSFVVFLLIANSITSDDTSTFVLCESTAIVGALLATGGLHSVIVRTLRNWRDDFPRQLVLSFGRKITTIYIGLFLLAGLTAFAISSLLRHTDADRIGQHIAVVILWMLLLGANQIVAEFLRGFENFRDAASMGGQNSGILTLSVLIPILVASKITTSMSIEIVFASQLFAMSVTLTFGLLRLRKTIRARTCPDAPSHESLRNDLQISKIFSEGAPNLFTQITTLGITHSEILILGQLSTGPEIAVYAGIKRLVQVTGAPLMVINSALPTFIADLVSQKDLGRLEAILRGASTLCFIPLLVMSIIFIACPTFTLSFFFGTDYVVGVRCLQILSVGNIAAVASGSCGLLLMMSGNQRYGMLGGTIGAVVFVAMAPSLAATFGITGMALGVASSTIVRNSITAIFARRCVGIWSTPTLSRNILFESFQVIWNTK